MGRDNSVVQCETSRGQLVPREGQEMQKMY